MREAAQATQREQNRAVERERPISKSTYSRYVKFIGGSQVIANKKDRGRTEATHSIRDHVQQVLINQAACRDRENLFSPENGTVAQLKMMFDETPNWFRFDGKNGGRRVVIVRYLLPEGASQLPQFLNFFGNLSNIVDNTDCVLVSRRSNRL